jgi:Tfp pilus assembly protein PilF
MNVVARNPYVAGNPVGDSPAFIGRQDVVRAVLRVLRHEQQNAIVLYGQRRIGKTSILQHLQAHLPEEGPYRPVYFDLQDKASLPLGRVLHDLAEAIAYALGQPAPDLGPDPETAFRNEWLPAILAALPEDSAVVLLLDEFDVLADAGADQAAKAFFPYLRGLLASDPARLQFEFVIGRNVDDLDNIALSVFKGTPARRISLMSQEDCAELVRLSEANGTLSWADDAVERIWGLACGHPFLTQQLCSHVWEQAYDEASWSEDADGPPIVTAADVDAAVPEALDASRNTMEWLWDGLPPAERVVASALAEAGSAAITPEGLERLLRESGVRVVIRELQSAPQLLQDWDLIEPADGGYRFRVELLRRWIAENKPLSRVQEELDHVEPVAENLYQAALGLYQRNELEQGAELLRRTVAINPNHVRANQLLADILLVQDKPYDARQLLERLYEYQPGAARPRLVQALLAEALTVSRDDDRLAIYERVLALDPAQPEALSGKKQVWQQRGDTALATDDLNTALSAYQAAGLTDPAARVENEIRRRELDVRLAELATLEQKKRLPEALALIRELAISYPGMQDWQSEEARINRDKRRDESSVRLKEIQALERVERFQDALDLGRQLANDYADVADWTPFLERLEHQAELKGLYQRGLGALQSGDMQTAQTLLARLVNLEPGYQEATRYLHMAVAGQDPVGLQAQLEAAAQREARALAEQKKPKGRWRWRVTGCLSFLGGLFIALTIGLFTTLVITFFTGLPADVTTSEEIVDSVGRAFINGSIVGIILVLIGLVPSVWWALKVWRQR